MTLSAVGLGVGVLISTLNISSTFSGFIEEELSHNGIVLNVANADYSNEGGLERVRPPEFDSEVIETIKAELPGVSEISPAVIPFFDLQVRTEGTTYRIRSMLGVNEEYLDLMDLNIISGTGFTSGDIESGSKNAVISEELAVNLFGSPESALGKTIRPPRTNTTEETGTSDTNRQQGLRQRFAPPTYVITGAFETPTELKRKSFGIGDVLVPYLSLIPGGMNIEMAQGLLLSNLVVRTTGMSVEAAESSLRDILSREYGDDLSLHIWEGTPGGSESVLEEARQSLGTMTIVINLLGFILLITGMIGILSIMIVEVAGRNREIAMKQALGAHKTIIIKEFWLRAVILSLFSAGFGMLLSVLLLNPLRDIIIPIFSDISMGQISTSIFQPLSAAVGVGAAVLFGGVFGIFPIFGALKTPISEGIREV